MAVLAAEPGDGEDLPGPLRHGLYLVPESSDPPEGADRPAGPGSGFESGGALDASAPDCLLAGLADSVTRAGRLTALADDELVGVMRAWQRLGSWCSAGLLTAIAELARRRPADRTPPAPPGKFPAQISEFVVDEVAHALTLTGRAADTLYGVSVDLETRLLVTARAQQEGLLDYPRVRLIAEMTRILSNDDARAVEALIFPKATKQTTGQLRAALARAILAVDPDAAARRREEALKDPRVRRWREDAGTAALAGFGLPPAEVLAADQRLTGRANALRDAGRPGTLEELRARAYLDALLGTDSSLTPPLHSGEPGDSGSPGLAPHGPTPAPVPAPAPATAPAPPIASRVTLTIPLGTGLGHGDQPGTVAGFGSVDGPLARDLLTAAAAHPASRFCLTLTGKDGQAIGHGCLPGSRSWQHLTVQGLTVSIRPLATGRCDHRHQEPGYQPSRKLQHLIQARTPTCSAPGCQRAATRCDLDHTTPWDQGGRTCECGLAPLCRHHHRCKQAQGWHLEQPQPGIMAWTTPAGRRHLTEPDSYP
jgi:hypothetical protein